ncbi:MAG: amino acid ABC transporter substrate-binding protein [Desulfobacterales bacterium]|nr:amino acid ABC transporter substrate-binding protein [Desulfobacterales bacterium]
MMKLFCKCAVFIAVVVIASPCWAEPTKQTVKIILEDKESFPWSMDDGVNINWEFPGISLELLRMVENKLGLKFEYYRTEWKRGLYLIEQGDGDAIFPSSYRKERAKYAVYPMKNNAPDPSRAIRTYAYWLYVRKDSGVTWDGQHIEHLNKPVAARQGSAISADLKEMGYAVDNQARVYTLMLEMLLTHRVDAIAGFAHQVDVHMAKRPERYTTITRIDIPLREKNGYLMFSKHFARQHSDIMEQIWDMIRTIKTSPEFEKIIQKYQSHKASE